MATLAAQKFSNAGAAMAAAATAAGGDDFVYTGKRSLVVFRNGHSSPITIACAPAVPNQIVDGIGAVTAPSRSLALAAGASGVFSFGPNNAGAYVDPNSGKIAFTYTGHNALLVASVVEVE